MTTLLRGGLVVTEDGARTADLRTAQDGTIAAIGELELVPGESVLDCTGMVLLPGAIDPHTHLDLECGPDLTTADDFATGSRSALAGGTTTVIDFATQFHGQTLAEGLAHWHAKADGHAVIDYAFHLAMTQWRPEFAAELADMVAAGVTSFKLYLAYRHSMMVEDDEVLAALTASAALGTTIGFHCENGRIIDALVQRERAAGHTGAYYHQHTHPAELERESLVRLGAIADLVDAQHYIVHLSSALTVPEVRAAQARGSRLVAETCPQYLVLDHTAYGGPGADAEGEARARAAVMSPPLRPAADHDTLWAGLADGTISFVGTDHCSFTPEQKAAAADFSTVPNGAPGLELRLALLHSHGVTTGRLTLAQLAAVTATNAARYFGLYPRKGVLAPGSDADIVVLDPTAQWTVTHDALHDAARHTPYAGMPLTGRVRDVFLRGQHLVRDGSLAPDLPAGRFVRCELPGREPLDFTPTPNRG
jgi:dihydropyrimidinase